MKLQFILSYLIPAEFLLRNRPKFGLMDNIFAFYLG